MLGPRHAVILRLEVMSARIRVGMGERCGSVLLIRMNILPGFLEQVKEENKRHLSSN